MKLKDRKMARCSKCNNTTGVLQEESYGCDGCEKPMDDQLDRNNIHKKHRDHLDITIFRNDGGNQTLNFCSWACLFKYLPTVRTDYFVSLPYLNYEDGWPGTTAKDFFNLIKGLAK